MSFSWESLDAATTALDRMRQGVHALPDESSAQPDATYIARFTDHVNDDLNVPRALALAWEVLRGDLPPAIRRATLVKFDAVLGLGLGEWRPMEEVAPPDVLALADARAAARGAKAWAEADRLRGALAAAGWEMEDLGQGFKLKRLKSGPGAKG
jgi:cysteinyl-tRNA synthetase